ncbi:integrin alpha, partial [Streptomyces sp. NPDC005534]|uniref:integrin alpha n=1 Tax=Streptomyces sp. NPDC005534 TaxID=3155714 RepID=UPI0034534ECD
MATAGTDRESGTALSGCRVSSETNELQAAPLIVAVLRYPPFAKESPLHRAVRAAAVLAPLLTVTLGPAPASATAPFKGANTAAVQDDFNGDGYRDLVVGAPR